MPISLAVLVWVFGGLVAAIDPFDQSGAWRSSVRWRSFGLLSEVTNVSAFATEPVRGPGPRAGR